ncbi:putative sterigmatocystin biosynthesis P450 monooxygenase stcF-like protein 2 [Colletotrichum chlorophyti]|uniref:Putative sterigmatocystin biosynthesis P450 monooxygenase stcF-like protein 2 n=1 Tax=Colletotrichum chlorophyti TaxID=708187 RepID=A0A1Q8RRY6_9PEZI|nr:putative sterigmatocystin biosynthesis P450 monooxygenase stcF-like protein 2 [Colletotrichum chlorophyti]
MLSLASSIGLAGLVIACWLLTIAILHVIHNLFFHPLSKYPGPRLAAITPLVHHYHFVAGDAVVWLDRLHKKYGEVVRIEPGRLSYIATQAWKDIYGHATATRKANSKEGKNSKNLFSNGTYSISSAHGPEHQRLRKIFSSAFSDRAITKQEPMLLLYTRQLVDLVHRKIAEVGSSADSVILDAVSLFNFATFDIMADLAFGESLGCLEKGGSNAWVDAVQVNFKSMIVKARLRPYPALLYAWQMFQPAQDKKAAALHVQSSHDRVTKRLEKGPDARDDIWGLVLRAERPNALTRTEMNNNANNFMIVGTETSATALSALTYLLVKNPEKLQRLVKEVRSVDGTGQLKGDVVRDMSYLQACLSECLRLHPPVPTGGTRVIGQDGNTILGQFVPEEVGSVALCLLRPCSQSDSWVIPLLIVTRLSIATWTAFRSPIYWKDGDKFVPERWIPGERGYEEYHAYDKQSVFQVFGTGPRACIGKNLAYQEMRLLYANFLYNFDIELCPESDGWMETQKCWTLWFKDQLRIRVSARKAD